MFQISVFYITHKLLDRAINVKPSCKVHRLNITNATNGTKYCTLSKQILSNIYNNIYIC